MDTMKTCIALFLATLCFATASLSARAIDLSPALESRRPSQSGVEYRPIPASQLRDYEVRHGVGTNIPTSNYISHGISGLMSAVDTEYGLRDAESFYWGPNGNPLANLTAYVGSRAVRVLSMERFDRVLDNAECTSDTVKLKFNKEVQFDQVQSEWAWVNQQDYNYIVLVTESARCNIPDGDPTDRQPWHVKNIEFDDDTNTVTLSAEPKTWEDAFDHWRLRISSHGVVPHAQALEKRIGVDDTFSVSLAADFSTGAVTLEDEDTGTSGTVSCDPCYTTGSLDFDIDVTWYLFEGLKGYVTMTPNDIGAFVTMSVETEQEILKGLSKEENLFTWPGSRIYIKNLVNIGPNFKVDLAAGIGKASAKVSASSGVEVTIPADSIAILDFSDSSNNEVHGWTPVFDTHVQEDPFSAELSLEASLGVVLRLEFDAQILEWGLAAGLALSAPTWKMTLTGVDEPDACDVPGNFFGLEYEYTIGYSLDGFAVFGSATDMPGKFNILGEEWPIYENCVPVASPAPSASASALPPYPVPGNSSVVAVATAR